VKILAGTTITLISAGLLVASTARADEATSAISSPETVRVLFLPVTGHQGEAVQAGALLSQSLEATLSAAAAEQRVELLTAADLGRVAGRSPQEHLARCSDACLTVCQHRLGRLAGLDWVVTGTVMDVSPTTRLVELLLVDLHAPLSDPRMLPFELQVTGHHSAIAASERELVASVQRVVMGLEREDEATSCCGGEASRGVAPSYFVAPFDVAPRERDLGQGVELAGRLEAAFDETLRLDARRLEPRTLGVVTDYDSGVFLESCPPGDHYQCALHVAENTGVDWAVTGLVLESPVALGARSVQVTFVNRANPQVGEVEISQEAVLLVDEPDAERRFLERVVAGFEFFVRSESCEGGCEQEPDLRVHVWMPREQLESGADEQPLVERDEVTDTLITLDSGRGSRGERLNIEELDGSEASGDLDDLRPGVRDEAPGFTVAERGGDLVFEGGAAVWYASTGTALYGDVVLDSYQEDEALAVGSYLVAEKRPSASVALGLGLGLSRRTDLMLRAGLFAGSYHQALSTKEWDSWDEIVVWDDLDERDGTGGFMAWHAQALLHISLRPLPLVDEGLSSGDGAVDGVGSGGRDLGGTSGGDAAAASSADERIEELDLDDEAELDPTLPPVELRQVATERRLAPFVEIGGGVLQLPLPATQQSHLPSSVQTWDGFTWPNARLALGLEYGIAAKLDVALMLPLYLHFGPATHSAEQGDLELLTFLEDSPSIAWGTGIELLVRPRFGLGE